MITVRCARTPDGLETAISASAPATATAAGHRVGHAHLPHVVVERAANGGLMIERGGWGGRPAYVRCERDLALASTDIAWITEQSRALGWSLAIDPERVAADCFFDAGADGSTRTIFREISEIPPGTRAHVEPGRITIERLDPPRVRDDGGSNLLRKLQGLLWAAMERAIDGNERIGVLTGGGLDSGALLAMAHALAPQTMAFALSFGGEREGEGDDRPHLAALARTLGLVPICAAPSDAPLPPTLSAAGLPLTWPSGAAEALLLRHARTWGADIVLAGLGADELFDGDPEAAALLVRSRGLRAALSAARGYDGAGLRRAFARTLWPSFRRIFPWSLRRMSRRRVRLHHPDWAGPTARRVLAEAHERAMAERPWIERSVEDRVKSAFFDAHFARASTLRLQEEQLSGTLRVDPYLDAELATFALSVPPNELLGRGERRGLFRDALVGVLPESSRTRTDKASFAPLHRALFRSPLIEELRAHASVRRLADLGIIEPAAFGRSLELAVGGVGAGVVDARLYAVLAVEAFLGAW